MFMALARVSARSFSETKINGVKTPLLRSSVRKSKPVFCGIIQSDRITSNLPKLSLDEASETEPVLITSNSWFSPKTFPIVCRNAGSSSTCRMRIILSAFQSVVMVWALDVIKTITGCSKPDSIRWFRGKLFVKGESVS